jgi:replicative DNA helicase
MAEALNDIGLKKLLPHSVEAERYVLGACLKSNDVFARALETIEADDFYKNSSRKVFAAMSALFEANEEIDMLTLSERLRKNGDLDSVGGMEFLDILDDLTPTAGALTHHAKIVRDKRVLRDLITSATDIVNLSYEDTDDVETLLDKAETAIFEISEKKSKRTFFPIKEVLSKSFEAIEKLFEKPGLVTGVETGFVDLDRMTAGFQPSDLIIIAGRPSMGKTSFALDISRFASTRRGIPTAIFSLEMSKEQLALRLLCSEARVDSTKVRTGYLGKADWPKLTAAGSRLADAPIFIDDSPAVSSLDVRAKARRLYAEHKVGLIVIDYLQLMHSNRNSESRQLEISEISRSMKALAKELNVPIVALSQLSRAVESRTDKRPMLSDLRESGSIEQDADVVMFIYRDEVYNPEAGQEGKAEILVRKQRNGPIGEAHIAFLKNYTRFENLEEREMPPDISPEEYDGEVPF